MQPVVPHVMFPETVNEPVVTLNTLLRAVTVADIVRVVPTDIEPAFTLIVQVRLVAGRGIDTAPETVSEFVPLIVMAEFVFTAANVIEAQAAGAVTVTVIPELIVTLSPATGTDCPPQVAVLFQSPVTEAVLFASGASAGGPGISLITAASSSETAFPGV